MRESCRLLFLLLVLTGCFACTAKKDSADSIEKKPVAEMPSGLAEKGKPLFNTCKTCHGDSGEGNPKLKAPSLISTDGWYLYRQLMHFKHGIRGYLNADTAGQQMAAMANVLKDSVEVSHVVAYIETLPKVLPAITLTGDLKKGERTYQSICGSCHGPQGKGNQAMHAPRLNGLDDWYLKRQLIAYKNSIRGMHPDDTYGSQMVSMAGLLKDDQAIDDVIAYIRSTHPVAP